jgi:hypothetical protein
LFTVLLFWLLNRKFCAEEKQDVHGGERGKIANLYSCIFQQPPPGVPQPAAQRPAAARLGQEHEQREKRLQGL